MQFVLLHIFGILYLNKDEYYIGNFTELQNAEY